MVHGMSETQREEQGGPFIFEHCIKEFTDQATPTRHTNQKLEVRKRKFECEFWTKSYGNKKLLSQHVNTCKSNPDKETLHCEACRIVFSNKDNFNRHFQVQHFNKWEFASGLKVKHQMRHRQSSNVPERDVSKKRVFALQVRRFILH